MIENSNIFLTTSPQADTRSEEHQKHNDLSQQELRDSVNGATIPSIDEHLFQSNEGLSQLEDQATRETNNTLVISEYIDLTNPSFSSISQLQPDTSMHSNIANQSHLRNMDYNTKDLVNRIFEENGEIDM
jgi:hypothetical protein